MEIKITKEQMRKLDCICGLCNHDFSARSCPYNKICDAPSPGEEEKKQFQKLLAEVVDLNVKKAVNAKITKKGKRNGSK